MAKIVVPEQDFSVGIASFDRPGVVVQDAGYKAQVSRGGMSNLQGLVSILRISLIYADRTVSASAEIVGGDTIQRDGQVAAFSSIAGTWPGEFVNGQRQVQRPDSMRMEYEVVQPHRAALEFDSLKDSDINPQAGSNH